MMKKILTVILSLIMTVSSFSATLISYADNSSENYMLHISGTVKSINSYFGFIAAKLEANTQYTIEYKYKFVSDVAFGFGGDSRVDGDVYFLLGGYMSSYSSNGNYRGSMWRQSDVADSHEKAFTSKTDDGKKMTYTFTLTGNETDFDASESSRLSFVFNTSSTYDTEFYIADMVMYKSDDTSKTNLINNKFNSTAMSDMYIYWKQTTSLTTRIDSDFAGSVGYIAEFEKYSTDVFSEETVTKEYGDANEDGEIDIRDLIKTNKLIINDSYSVFADVTKDGKLNSEDLILLRKYLLGIKSLYEPVESADLSNIIPIARLGYKPYTGEYPQQSIDSYKEAYKMGHRIMLCDLRLTSDDAMVCVHDDDISRVNARDSGGNKVQGDKVLVSQTEIDELLKYDFSCNKGTTIPLSVLRFEHFIKFCAEYKEDIIPCIEIKVILNEQHIKYISTIVKQYGYEDKIMFVMGINNNNTALLIANEFPNSTIGWWTYYITDNLINQMSQYNVKNKFIYIGSDGKQEDTIINNYDKCMKNGIDIGFTYIPSSNRSYYNDLKEKGILNRCKYLALDEISWLYE